MRVAIAPELQEAVFDHRLRWPAEHLHSAGEIELVPLPGELDVRHAVREHGLEPVGVKNLPDVDVLVITRVLAGAMADALPMIQRRGIAVVVDVDDDFRHLPPGMADRRKADQPLYSWRHTARACATADLVTCSTDALRAYAPHGRVAVLRNCVPERYLSIKAKRDGKTVGWAGSALSHPGDLEVTRGGVGMALRETGADFMVVGPDARVQRALDLPERPWATGIVPHMIYPYKMAEFDVGICPLVDSAFNRSKSFLKPLQLLAMGVLAVCSPTPEYERLVRELETWQSSNPCPAELARDKSKDWRRAIVRALGMPEEARQECQQVGREFVADRHTVELNSWRWAEAWSSALRCAVA